MSTAESFNKFWAEAEVGQVLVVESDNYVVKVEVVAKENKEKKV